MKKRIISLILVVVMSAMALVGCAYSYAKDDMSDYADFDKDKFFAAIQDLKIVDGDFGTDEDERWAKVEDAIYTTLAGKADKEEQLKNGVPTAHDLYYYCYFATATIGGEEVILLADALQQSKASSLQLGLSTLEGLKAGIAELVKDKDIKDYLYATTTSGKSEAGDVAYISYTKEYVTTTTDSEGVQKETTVKTVVAYEKVTLGVKDGETFLDKLVDKNVGSTLDAVKVKETIDGKEYEVSYSGIKINWLVDSMTEIGTVKDVTYTGETETKKKDIYGKEHKLNDVELTYHIFPVYFVDVIEEVNARVILDTIFGKNISSSSLEVLGEESKYKNGEDSVSALVTKLAELATTLEEADKSLDKAIEDYDAACKVVEDAGVNEDGSSKATTAQLNAKADAEEAKKDAETARNQARADVDAQLDKILAATSTEAEAKPISEVIVEEYKQSRYDALEKTYENEIKMALAKEIYSYAKKYITYNGTLPKKACKNAYERLINNYKYDFYEGKTGSGATANTNYNEYGGDFDAFLKAEIEAETKKTYDSKKAVEDAVWDMGEESVKELVLVYTLAELYGDAVAVTDEDIEEFKTSFNYYILAYQVGEDNIDDNDYIHAIQLDNILDHLLEVKEKAEGDESNVIEYVRIKYTFKDDSKPEVE